jgi:hypothetical protein
VEVTVKDKRANLLKYGTNYDRKSFTKQAVGQMEEGAIKVVIFVLHQICNFNKLKI